MFEQLALRSLARFGGKNVVIRAARMLGQSASMQVDDVVHPIEPLSRIELPVLRGSVTYGAGENLYILLQTAKCVLQSALRNGKC